MSILDPVIRPNQTPDVAPGVRYVSSGQKAADPVLLQIGRSGRGKTFQGHYSLKETFYMTKYVAEIKSPFITSQDFNGFQGNFGTGTIGNAGGG